MSPVQYGVAFSSLIEQGEGDERFADLPALYRHTKGVAITEDGWEFLLFGSGSPSMVYGAPELSVTVNRGGEIERGLELENLGVGVVTNAL